MLAQERMDEDLNLLLDIARNEYRIMTVDDRAFQASHIKTYLWLATVMLAAIVALADSAMRSGRILFLDGACSGCFYIFGSASLLLAGLAFLLGIDSLRARSDIICFGRPRELFELAEKSAQEKDPQRFRISLLRTLDRSLISQREETNRTGLRLRRMSLLLLWSVVSGVCAVLAFAICRHP